MNIIAREYQGILLMNSLGTTLLMENLKAGLFSLRALGMESILNYYFAKFIQNRTTSFLVYNVKNAP